MATLNQFRTCPEWAHVAWTPQTYHQMGTLWAALDKNGDKFINEQDFTRGDFMRKWGLLAGKETWNKVKKHFKGMDTNHDGKISRTEFLEGMARWGKDWQSNVPGT